MKKNIIIAGSVTLVLALLAWIFGSYLPSADTLPSPSLPTAQTLPENSGQKTARTSGPSVAAEKLAPLPTDAKQAIDTELSSVDKELDALDKSLAEDTTDSELGI